ncbi:MAG: hypothetical protein JNK29_18015 [Anaerolineales bacterium]|nr:hypothetical protein [Anaerolineales bacterium]
MSPWLLLLYRIPSEPSARRVYVWRKLKRLGALLLQDAIWVLPDTARTREQFQWLAAEIVELGGEAHLWASQPVLAEAEAALVRQFREQAETAYRAIAAALEQDECDLAALSRQFQQAQQADYFHAPLGQQVRAALIAARESKAA